MVVAVAGDDQSWGVGGEQASLAHPEPQLHLGWPRCRGYRLLTSTFGPQCSVPSQHHHFHLCPLGFPTLSILCPRQMPRFGIDGAEQELTAQESAPRTPPPSTLGSAASSLVLAST